ncbi:4-hydroxybenzoate octaprenyltransferase [Betaproteobacteria bacterium]|nr:4-hydroxybenzoate octaprenyltransferase [Betaproteobacteria bacterium]GHT96848.1 4-hydroxybenzoate octaprenyltransferase [Betaproteobacteria bacterium]GHU10126.1 4-hydroxybenzoate octaprenyltransferase [Betaproteobacteria bacterium]GHU17353.1 4-hydroxybenzoate octaprenyltransferase [Betaproteobacteria bacterium]GHU22419.1 4-hydroxybenzoate octaprenyltransferase [Betaproteobacteria bacterium]
MNIVARLPLYARLIRIDTLDKQVGTMLLLWPTMWALWLAAGGLPPLHLVLIFALGSFLMHSAGCVVNDYADRDFDGHVERTRSRPFATGAVSVREGVLVTVGLLLLAFLLLLPLDRLVFRLALVALFLAGSYPFTKRFLPVPQAYLGLAYSFGVPMGFAAVLGTVPVLAWVLLVATAFWVVAFDTEYAMVDREDDLRLGRIQTSAITFGRFEVLAVMLCYAASFALITVVGLLSGRGWVFLAGMAVAVALAIYHYTLIRTRERAPCWRAFVHNNWVGAAIFAGLSLDYLVRG